MGSRSVEKQRLTQLFIKHPKINPITGEANTESASVDVPRDSMKWMIVAVNLAHCTRVSGKA